MPIYWLILNWSEPVGIRTLNVVGFYWLVIIWCLRT